jgi:hypothetical protein
VYNEKIKKIFRSAGRIAVPDLFLRWGDIILAIEAKFFTQPSAVDLTDQLSLQRKAFDAIKEQLPYKSENIMQCLLMINKPTGITNNKIALLTWSEIADLLKSNPPVNCTSDYTYALNVLLNSIERAKNELNSKSNLTFTKVKTIDELIQRLPEFIKNGQIWVGFSEDTTLESISLTDLQNRDHYKVSDTKYTSNWIRIDMLVSAYLNLDHP